MLKAIANESIFHLYLLAVLAIVANVAIVAAFIRRRCLPKDSKVPITIMGVSIVVQDIALFMSKKAFVYMQAFALYILFFGMLINILISRHKQD